MLVLVWNFISVTQVIRSKLKHQVDLLYSIVPSTTQQSLVPATFCLSSIVTSFPTQPN